MENDRNSKNVTTCLKMTKSELEKKQGNFGGNMAEKWGTVNLGMQRLRGNERPNPHNQELTLEPSKYQFNDNQFNESSEGSMPLIHGSSQESVHENIKRELAAGKPRKQAIAIAMNTAREAKKHGDVGSISKKEIYRSKYQNRGEMLNQQGTIEQEQPYI